MSTRTRRKTVRKRQEKGAAVAELAVTLPLLVFIMVGAVDLGRLWADVISVSNAAHAGAQYGAQSEAAASYTAGIEGAVFYDLGTTSDADPDLDVTAESYCECSDGRTVACDAHCGFPDPTPRKYVDVAIDRTFRPMLNYPGFPRVVNVTVAARQRAR